MSFQSKESKPVLTFGSTEVFVVNTFLQAGRGDLSDVAVHGTMSEPAEVAESDKASQEAEEMPIMRWKTYDSYEDEDEEPVVPWRTFDSYEANDPDEELKPVNKVSTLEYFERVQAFERLAPTDDGTPVAHSSSDMQKVSTFDSFEDAPSPPCNITVVPPGPECGMQDVTEAHWSRLSTFDSFEHGAPPMPVLMGRPVPPAADMMTAQKSDRSTAFSDQCSNATGTPGVTPRGTAPLTTTIQGGKEFIHWKVDGRKLETQEKQILSPEFELTVPGLPQPLPFRLMILARETRGKGCRGFLKAKGCGRLFIKCLAGSLPESLPPMSFRAIIGGGMEEMRHQFSEHPLCPLQNKDDWDFLSMLGTSKRFEVSVQVL